MKKVVCVLLISVSLVGCAYTPKTLKPVNDEALFSQDLSDCKMHVRNMRMRDMSNQPGKTLAVGLFGIVGAAAVSNGEKDSFNTSPKYFIDECMREKGYDVPEKDWGAF